MDGYYALLVYRLLNSRDCIARGRLVQIARFDALVVTALKSMKMCEKSCVHRKHVYADTFKSHVSKAVKQLTRLDLRSVRYRDYENLIIACKGTKSDSKSVRKLNAPRQPR